MNISLEEKQIPNLRANSLNLFFIPITIHLWIFIILFCNARRLLPELFYWCICLQRHAFHTPLHSHNRTVKQHTNTLSLEVVKRMRIWTYASGQQEYQMTHPKQFKKPLKNETILFKEFSNWWAKLRQDALVSVFKGLTWQPPAVHNLLVPINKF